MVKHNYVFGVYACFGVAYLQPEWVIQTTWLLLVAAATIITSWLAVESLISSAFWTVRYAWNFNEWRGQRNGRRISQRDEFCWRHWEIARGNRGNVFQCEQSVPYTKLYSSMERRKEQKRHPRLALRKLLLFPAYAVSVWTQTKKVK